MKPYSGAAAAAASAAAAGDAAPALSPWADALRAAALAAIDPRIGVWLRAGAGPVRDRWLAVHRALLDAACTLRRLPGHIADERLLGGLDLVATLGAARPVMQRGLLAEADGGVVIVPMAERLPAGIAAKLVAAQDAGEVRIERDGIAARVPARFGLVVLDEGGRDDEKPPAALLDRLGLVIDLDGIAPRAAEAFEPDAAERAAIAAARERLARVAIGEPLLQALAAGAEAFGVPSLRSLWLADRAARAHAVLEGRDAVEAEDVAAALRFVIAPRATRWPEPPADEPEAEEAPPPPEPPQDRDEPPPDADDAPPPPPNADEPLEDLVLEAALASLPPELLRHLQAGAQRRSGGDARGTGRAGGPGPVAMRGRPAGVRRGSPRSGLRLDLIETLRAAAPWQRLRARLAPPAADGAPRPGIRVLADDFRVVHRKAPRESTTLFVVDASGSSALHRLAEAKGAVELLLADCYVRRDRVALIAFRGRAAELLLPPTRSLVRAKRSLAGLPGGGGTPLAAALKASAEVAAAVARRGDAPLVVLLTDGRANVALDGTGGRTQAEADALAAAGALRATGCAVLLIDTSSQPHPTARQLAEALRARYLPLPHAGAAELSRAVQSVASAP